MGLISYNWPSKVEEKRVFNCCLQYWNCAVCAMRFRLNYVRLYLSCGFLCSFASFCYFLVCVKYSVVTVKKEKSTTTVAFFLKQGMIVQVLCVGCGFEHGAPICKLQPWSNRILVFGNISSTGAMIFLTRIDHGISMTIYYIIICVY